MLETPYSGEDLQSIPDTASVRLSRAAAWLAGIMLILVSLARWDGFSYGHYAGGVLFQTAVLVLMLLSAAFVSLFPTGKTRPSRAIMLFLGYAIFCLFNHVLAKNPKLSLSAAASIAFSVGWAILLARCVRRESDILFVLRALFWAGVLASVAALAYVRHYFVTASPEAVSDLTTGRRFQFALAAIESVQGHRNFLAIFLLPALLLGMMDLFPRFSARADRPQLLGLHRAWVGISVLVVMIAFLMCTSMGGGLGLIAGLGVLLVIRLGPKGRKRLLIAGCFGIVPLVILLTHPAVGRWLIKHSGSQATRWYMWHGTVRMILERPILGWGAGMFHPYFADFKPIEPMRYNWLTSYTVYPHNEVLLVAVEGGLIALALYLGGFWKLIRRHLRLLTAETDAARRVLPLALLAALTAMFVQGLVSVALRFWAPVAAFWTLVGLMMAYAERREPGEKPAPLDTRTRNAQIFAMLVVVLGIAKVFVWDGARSEWLIARALNTRNLPVGERVSLLARAEKLSRYVPDYFIALRERADLLRRAGQVNKAIKTFEQMEREAPGYQHVRQRLGELYTAARDWERAVKILQKALEENPYDYGARGALMNAFLKAPSRDFSLAMEVAEEGILLAPERPDGYYVMANFYVLIGNREKAEEFYQQALEHCGKRDEELAVNLRRKLPDKP